MLRYFLLVLVIVLIAAGSYLFLSSQGYLTTSSNPDSTAQITTTPSETITPPQELVDRGWIWKETTFPGGEPVSPNVESQFVVTFTADGTLSAQTDCNTFMGSYKLSGENKIAIEAMASTMMACTGPEIQQDMFMEQLNRASTYELTETGLTLGLSDSSQMIFE